MSDMLLAIWTQLQNRTDMEETGATAVEYGMIVALIAGVIVAVVGTVGTQVHDAFGSLVGQF